VNAQLHGQFAARRDSIAGAKFARMDERAKLIAKLDVEGNVAFRLNLEGQHWLSPTGQYSIENWLEKSQFVFS